VCLFHFSIFPSLFYLTRLLFTIYIYIYIYNIPPFLVPPSYCECNPLSTSAHITMLLQYTRSTNVRTAMMRLCLALRWKWACKKNVIAIMKSV
jgi:hypothetical protein